MSKHKKKKPDDWTSFITRLLSRKRSNRQYKFPKDYILSLADKIHRINPSRQIVYNTLTDVYCNAHESGYQHCHEDRTFFKNKEKKQFEKDWNKFKDGVDDKIHGKPIQQQK